MNDLPAPVASVINAGLRMNLTRATPDVKDHTLSELAAEANLWPIQLKVSGKFK